MIRRRLCALSEKLRQNHIDHALLCSLASLGYFTRYNAPLETGPSPFTSVLGVLLCLRGEKPALFLADMETPPERFDGEITRETFSSYTIKKNLEATPDLTAKLIVRLKKLLRGKVGIEAEDLPAAAPESFPIGCPHLEFRDFTPQLAEIRMVKDEEEIQTPRECIALCDVGQELTKKLVRAGMSETELFAEVRKGTEMKEGGRLPILSDLVAGPRTAQMGGNPSARRIEPGDLIISASALKLSEDKQEKGGSAWDVSAERLPSSREPAAV